DPQVERGAVPPGQQTPAGFSRLMLNGRNILRHSRLLSYRYPAVIARCHKRGYNRGRRRVMPGRVQGKVAIVTGGGTGIGQGIAVMLAREGARVVVANRSATTGEETVRLAREAGSASGAGGTAVF